MQVEEQREGESPGGRRPSWIGRPRRPSMPKSRQRRDEERRGRRSGKGGADAKAGTRQRLCTPRRHPWRDDKGARDDDPGARKRRLTGRGGKPLLLLLLATAGTLRKKEPSARLRLQSTLFSRPLGQSSGSHHWRRSSGEDFCWRAVTMRSRSGRDTDDDTSGSGSNGDDGGSIKIHVSSGRRMRQQSWAPATGLSPGSHPCPIDLLQLLLLGPRGAVPRMARLDVLFCCLKKLFSIKLL